MSSKGVTRKQALNAIDLLSKVAKKGMVGYQTPMNKKKRTTKKKSASSGSKRKRH